MNDIFYHACELFYTSEIVCAHGKRLKKKLFLISTNF